MTRCRSVLFTIAYSMAILIINSEAQQVYNLQGYQQPQHGYQNYQPYPYQQPQQTLAVEQAQHPGKVTGYDAQAVIPPNGSPLKNLDESQGNPKYVDFINTLYRHDRTKQALHYEENQHRQKRALVFRPMFVYKQQKVHKEKVKAEREAEAANRGSVAANQSPHYKDKQNNVYREYNSFYDPYRYGQRYPYRNY